MLRLSVPILECPNWHGFLHLTVMLGGEGSSRGHRRAIPRLSRRDASHALSNHARRSQAVAFGPHTPMAGAGRVYLRRQPSRRQPPSRLRPGLRWLHPTVGRSKRAAAVNRPARMNAQRGAFRRRTKTVGLSQASYPLKIEMVLCLGLRSEILIARRQECIAYLLTQSRELSL